MLITGDDSTWDGPFFLVVDRGAVTVECGGALNVGRAGLLVLQRGELAGDGEGTPCDFDGSGVGITDFLLMIASWGAFPQV